MDGGSNDGSVEIIKKYEKYLTYWESKKDKGQYDAIQKGFEKCSGEVMAWINSDDIYHSNAFFVVAEIFIKFPHVQWLTSTISFIDEKDRMVKAYTTKQWSRYNLFTGNYGWIQQESTFWKKELWKESGSSLNTNYHLAADFELWVRFFRTQQLFTTEALLGAFRVRKKDQKTVELLDEYMKELHEILETEPLSADDQSKLKFIRWYEKYIQKIPVIRFSLKQKYLQCYNYPPRISFDRNNYSYIIESQQ